MAKRGQVNHDLCGKTFGCLTVTDVYRQKGSRKRTVWDCVCSNCGSIVEMQREAILRFDKDYCRECKPHGIRNEKLYHVYYGIKSRCYNKNNPSFKKYGAVGIVMCDEWINSYDSFKKWAIYNGYHDGLTIDRIDSTKGYFPENCRWLTLSENSARANIGKHKNKSKLGWFLAIDINGNEVYFDNISKFCREHNLNRSSVSAILHGRMKSNTYNGWKFKIVNTYINA